MESFFLLLQRALAIYSDTLNVDFLSVRMSVFTNFRKQLGWGAVSCRYLKHPKNPSPKKKRQYSHIKLVQRCIGNL